MQKHAYRFTPTKLQKTDNPPAIRKALTRNILERVLKSIQSHETGYNQTLYQTLFVFMYQGPLRCNEVAWCAKAPHNLTSEPGVPRGLLASEQVAMVRLKGKPHIRLRFKSYKHSKPNPPPIYLSAKIKKSSLCPVAAYRKYSKIKRGEGIFFQHRDGRPLIRRDISKTPKLHLAILGYNPAHYDTHSLRIGKTTDMGRQRYSNSQIALAGRWASDAYVKYLKPEFLVV